MNSRTKFRQKGGERDGRWRDLNGRFTSPPKHGDVEISQEQADERRERRRDSGAVEESPAHARRAGGTSPAAGKRREGRRETSGSAPAERRRGAERESPSGSQRPPSAKRSGNGKAQFDKIDKSWEKIKHADAALPAADADGKANQTDAAAAAAAMVDEKKDDGTKTSAEQQTIQRPDGDVRDGAGVDTDTSEVTPSHR